MTQTIKTRETNVHTGLGSQTQLPGFLRGLAKVDRRIILSGILALLLASLLMVLVLFGPVEARLGAAVGLFTMLIGLQLAVLFLRPLDRSAFGTARRAFAEGKFEAAVTQLETLLNTPKKQADPRILILLGNSYRQLGRLAESQARLGEALRLSPRQPSALYGLGRTVMAQGDFEAAADWFDQALAAGAPPVVGCELGLAEYLASNQAAAIKTLQKMTRRLQIETYRAWLINAILLLNVSNESTAAGTLRANIKLNASGRSYWQADADRHQTTDYGQRLRTLLNQIDELVTA